MSPKYALFADRAGQLQQRGIGRQTAKILIAGQTAILLEGEWLEAFWCDECQETKWYHIIKQDRIYQVLVAPSELWQQATGVINPDGNPSVGEFTRRHARTPNYQSSQDFHL